MKKIAEFEIAENRRIASETMCLTLLGDCGGITRPGQFVNLALPGKYLRRPISVCSVRGEMLTLIYKIVGDGTRQLAEMRPGETLELLTGLGNGFSVEKSGFKPLLIGGGAGVAPLYGLAEALLQAGKKPKAVLGFNKSDEIFLASELTALGVPCCISTADGSVGVKGFVTDVLRVARPEHDYLFACGPEPMLKAVYAADDTDGQYSFEARMACGFGACMCCSCETKRGAKRICRDGPVLERGEILW